MKSFVGTLRPAIAKGAAATSPRRSLETGPWLLQALQQRLNALFPLLAQGFSP